MAKVQPLTKPQYSPEQLAYFFRSANLQGQVTSNQVVYHYLNGDSRQFRTVVLLRDPSHTDAALEAARAEVCSRDPAVTRVTFVDYAYQVGLYGGGVSAAGGARLALVSSTLH